MIYWYLIKLSSNFQDIVIPCIIFGILGLLILAYLKEIAWYMGLELGKINIKRFADGEIYVQLQESVRGCDVYLVQPTCPPANENLMELLIMIDACRRASAKNITAVIPYFGYARADRKVNFTLWASGTDSSGIYVFALPSGLKEWRLYDERYGKFLVVNILENGTIITIMMYPNSLYGSYCSILRFSYDSRWYNKPLMSLVLLIYVSTGVTIFWSICRILMLYINNFFLFQTQGRESIAAKLVANLITEAGAHRVLACDLHSGQSVGYFDIPVDHVYCQVGTPKL